MFRSLSRICLATLAPAVLFARVLVREERQYLVFKPKPIARALIIAVDRDDRERLPGVLGVGEDRELVAAPQLEINRLVFVVRALDLYRAHVVQGRLRLRVLHHAVDVVGFVDLGEQRISKSITNNGSLWAGVVRVFA